MKHDLTEQIRDASYEALFHLGGFLAVAVHPTQRNLERVFAWIDESQLRRQQLKRLESRGLIEMGSGEGKAQWVVRLTDLGHSAFAGGRNPESAWNRGWDGQWRLLSFDLPRKAHPMRMKLRRWLVANDAGQLQGSVWIMPDPVPAVEEILGDVAVDPASFLVFEGAVAGTRDPREVAEKAWDFSAIDAGYRQYCEIAGRALDGLKGKTPTAVQLRRILTEDRKAWWEAVRRDPLLPKALHPKDYEGRVAWKVRGKLHKRLGRVVGAG